MAKRPFGTQRPRSKGRENAQLDGGGVSVHPEKISVARPCHELSVPDALSWTITGDRRHRWSLPYQRASDEGLKSELELRLESLCGWRRMRAAAPADPRISVRQVTLLAQLVYRAQRSGRPKNCRRSCRTRRERPRPVGAIAMILIVAFGVWCAGSADSRNWTTWGGLGLQCQSCSVLQASYGLSPQSRSVPPDSVPSPLQSGPATRLSGSVPPVVRTSPQS